MQQEQDLTLWNLTETLLTTNRIYQMETQIFSIVQLSAVHSLRRQTFFPLVYC